MPCYFVPSGIRFKDYLFSEPVQLSSWQPPDCAGVVAILVRNPQWGPKPLEPVYFGDNLRIPADRIPDDLLVSMLPMPYSTASQRRALCQELLAAYHRPASHADLARRVEMLEARQQEQSQQILSLLTFIGKLFEPQPVAPRRPIGFLPQLAEATETGS